MGMSGSEVSWYAVYFTDKVYATRLCSICLDGSARDADRDSNRAKFQVIRNLGRALRDYYANLHTGCTYRHTPHLLPQPNSIISHHRPASVDELKSLHLIILDRVPGAKKKFNTHRALFTGTIQRKGDSLRKRVYVKFVNSYSLQAHSYLASHDPPFAPKILFYGEVVSRITMIIMEDVRATPIHRSSILENTRLRSLIQPKTEEALSVLHAGGFVHGDIRSPNLLMDPITARVYIVDFDWDGKQDVARYPTNLNPEVKWIRPPLLLRNKVIMASDDTFMLQNELSGLLKADYVGKVPNLPPQPQSWARGRAGRKPATAMAMAMALVVTDLPRGREGPTHPLHLMRTRQTTKTTKMTMGMVPPPRWRSRSLRSRWLSVAYSSPSCYPASQCSVPLCMHPLRSLYPFCSRSIDMFLRVVVPLC